MPNTCIMCAAYGRPTRKRLRPLLAACAWRWVQENATLIAFKLNLSALISLANPRVVARHCRMPRDDWQVRNNIRIWLRNSLSARTISTLPLLLLSIILTGCKQQSDPQDSQPPLPVERIVKDISNRYRLDYLFPETGEQVARILLENLERGDYRDLRDASLAKRLTADLQKITSDVHAVVIYDPTLTPTRSKLVLPKNFHTSGVSHVERLTGNIGYMRITLFSMPKSFAPAIDAAMSSLAGTDALVIDVRDTPGGHSQSVAYLCSYFFEPGTRVHLNTFEYRWRPPVEEWTHSIPKPYLNRPVYVLTSAKTGSGAEALAYQMQAFGRALIVGATTQGGAHTGDLVRLEHGYAVLVPTGRAVNAATKTNWERVGVKPDLLSEADHALKTAIGHFTATSYSTPGADREAL